METAGFQTALLAWYAEHRRDLPWRRTTDPYRVLVSEVMLQQTQVGRVIPKYEAFLGEFPSAHDLGKAPPAKVLRLWSGLGYNRRAISLIAAAKELSSRIERGAVPLSVEEWRALPGVGPYTASAVMAFAENRPVTVIDTNIRRIIFRLFLGRPRRRWDKEVERIAGELVPKGRSRDWHNALMDFGAMVCMAKPRCEACPFRESCVSVAKLKRTPEQLEDIASTTFKTTQSRFKGSNRYYRGQVLKLLQKEDEQTLASLGKKVKEGFSKEDMPWLLGIVARLEKEGLVVLQGRRISLPSSSS